MRPSADGKPRTFMLGVITSVLIMIGAAGVTEDASAAGSTYLTESTQSTRQVESFPRMSAGIRW